MRRCIQYFFPQRLIYFVEVHRDVFFVIRFPSTDTMVVGATAGTTASGTEKFLIILLLEMNYILDTIRHFRNRDMYHSKSIRFIEARLFFTQHQQIEIIFLCHYRNERREIK